MNTSERIPHTTPLQDMGRLLMGSVLVTAGVGHLTFARDEFPAQVPEALVNGPLHFDEDFIVLASGVVEIGLGAALLAAPAPQRQNVGRVAAAFFTAVFPGNISQYLTRTDAFGLNSDAARMGRLFLQPVLVAGALWITGAWPRRC